VPPVFPSGAGRISPLEAEGYRFLVVSASPACYLASAARFLPVDAVIATPCGMDAEGVYTGEVGENCQGWISPADRGYLAANHLTLDYDASRAYGDSRSDLPC
jgi:phosphoserine phosphatase